VPLSLPLPLLAETDAGDFAKVIFAIGMFVFSLIVIAVRKAKRQGEADERLEELRRLDEELRRAKRARVPVAAPPVEAAEAVPFAIPVEPADVDAWSPAAVPGEAPGAALAYEPPPVEQPVAPPEARRRGKSRPSAPARAARDGGEIPLREAMVWRELLLPCVAMREER
jgi:hypothetical protein